MGPPVNPLDSPIFSPIFRAVLSFARKLQGGVVVRKVLTVGVFDYFHLGHLRLFKKARQLGDYLIVAVQDDDSIAKTKPDFETFYTTQERIELVEAVRVVDEVIIYKDVDALVPQIDFDIFAVGEDQNHEGFQRAIEWCKEHGKTVVRIKRTGGICSSRIKKNIMALR